MAKVNISKKRSAATQDNSHVISESWKELFLNIVIIAVISVTVWAGVTILTKAVYSTLNYIFESELVAGKSQYNFILLACVMLTAAFMRGFLVSYPNWKVEEGDGSTTTVYYFYDTYDDGTPDKEPVKHRYEKPTFMRAVKRIAITFLTVGTGGSGGLEGPTVAIGEALAAGCSKIFKVLNKDDLRMFQMAGISCGIATILHAPLTASVFAAEVVFADRLTYRPLMYSLLASLIAFELSSVYTPFNTFFNLSAKTAISYTYLEYLGVVLVAICISAPAGYAVTVVFNKLKILFDRIPILFRAPTGSLCALLIALIVWKGVGLGPDYVLGIGEHVVTDLLYGDNDSTLTIWWILFVLVFAKTFATGFTLMSGGSAGLLIPAMFMGGLSGGGVYYFIESFELLSLHSGHEVFVIAGISSALVAVIEVPLAAMILAMEVFGSNFGPPAILAVLVTHKIIKRNQLYQVQQEENLKTE